MLSNVDMKFDSGNASNFPFLRVAVLPATNFMEINTNEDNKIQLSGIEGFFMDIVLKALGFKYEIVIPSDREWGRLKDGNWTGMIGELLNNRADLA